MSVQCCLFYDWRHRLKPIFAWPRRKGVGIKRATQKLNQLVNELITRMFVEQPLALPGSGNYRNYAVWNGKWEYHATWVKRGRNRVFPTIYIFHSQVYQAVLPAIIPVVVRDLGKYCYWTMDRGSLKHLAPGSLLQYQYQYSSNVLGVQLLLGYE